MEENSEHLADLMRRYGYTQKEAQAAYHLDKAWVLLVELHLETVEEEPDDTYPDIEQETRKFWEAIENKIFEHIHIHTHFRELHRFLGMRVLRRIYPKGWEAADASEGDEG